MRESINLVVWRTKNILNDGCIFCQHDYSLCLALEGAVARGGSGDWPEKSSVGDAQFVRGLQVQKAKADSESIPLCIERQ
jgi:hypothetical protein